MTEAKVLVDIDNFLEEHRRKLSEDKKVLNDILNFLEEKQQAFVLDNGNYLQDSRLDKTDQESPDYVENHSYNLPNLYKDEFPRVMVRYGEFSPLNPVFRSSSRPLLGLGEYEERRKIFLEKKKREYQQYLSRAKNEKEQEKAKSKLPHGNRKDENHPRLKNIAEVDSVKTSPRTSNMPREVLSPGRGIVEATDRCYAWWQQQVYKRELDRQILDKKKRMKEEKERERVECEKKQKEMMMEQIKLSKSIAEQIRRYQMTEMLDDDVPTNEKYTQPINHENQIFIDGVNLPDPSSTPLCSLGFNPVPRLLESPPHRINSSIFNTATRSKSPENVPHRITSPIFNATPDHSRKPTPFHVDVIPREESDSSQSPSKNRMLESVTETPAESADQSKSTINGSNSKPERLLSNQKSQQEIYKNELARQIEEKKRIEMERKRKEAEEDRRIDERIKLDEEKLRQEFEKEQAERAYRATRRVQHEVRHQEQLTKFQKEAEERKKNIRPINNIAPTSKLSVHPTNHGFTQKGGMKNVSFATKACVYSFQNTNECVQNNNVSSTQNHNENPSQIIVEAPYILAVKGNEVNNNYSDGYKRPRSPPVPALRTQKLLSESVSKPENIIPSTVSMSPKAKEKFLKDAKILTNLSEIRRRLLLKHAGLESK